MPRNPVSNNDFDAFAVMVGARIQAAFRERGYETAADAGTAMGVSGMTMSRYFRGAQDPKLSTLRQIAQITDKPLYHFISSPGDKRRDPPVVIAVEREGRETVRFEVGESSELKLRFERG